MDLYEATGPDGFDRCELLSRVHALLVLGPRGKPPELREGKRVSAELAARAAQEQAAFSRGEGPDLMRGERRSGWTCRLCEVQEDADNPKRSEAEKIYRYRQLTELQEALAEDERRPVLQRRLSDELHIEVEAAIAAGVILERPVLGATVRRPTRGNRAHR